MTPEQRQQIEALLASDNTNPFHKSVYDSFLLMDEKSPQFEKEILLDIIRSLTVIIRQDIILISPYKFALQAHIKVYNILFSEEYELIAYVPHHWSAADVDEEASLIYNETIAKNKDGYYLCNSNVKPIDHSYDTLEELCKTHSSLGYLETFLS